MNQENIYNDFAIFIIGTTASGKTKLSIDLAEKFNGEIIRYL